MENLIDSKDKHAQKMEWFFHSFASIPMIITW